MPLPTSFCTRGLTASMLHVLVMGTVIFCWDRPALCLTDQEWQGLLDKLQKTDCALQDLERQIREDNVSWWDVEIVTSSRTNRFQREYVALKSQLQPVISGGIEGGRKHAASVKTMGQALASLPEMIPLLMTLVVYKGQLDHIEFMIESRRAVILGRLSVYIAVCFGLCAIIPLVPRLIPRRLSHRDSRSENPRTFDAHGCCPVSTQPVPTNRPKDEESPTQTQCPDGHVQVEPNAQVSHKARVRAQQEANRLRNLEKPKHVQKRIKQAKKRARRKKRG